MVVRLFGLLAVIVGTLALSVQSAGAEPGDPPDEPRCFVSFGDGDGNTAPTIAFEHVEIAKRISVRYDGSWITTLQTPVDTWSTPVPDAVAASFELVLWPGAERVRCSGTSPIAQLDLGPDNRACSYLDESRSAITIWGDFHGTTHVRNQARWLARLPQGSTEFSDDRLAESRALLRYRAPGQPGSIDIECTDEPVETIRFAQSDDAVIGPAETSLNNPNFTATLVGRTALVTDKRTGQTRSYAIAADDTLVHVSSDGRHLLWYRDGNPELTVAADLHERTYAPVTTKPAATPAASPVAARAAEPEGEPARAPLQVVHVSTNGRANGGGFTNARIQNALRQAPAGTAFEFAPGEHQPIRVSNLRGDRDHPIVITAADKNNPPTFTDNSYAGRAGIHLSDSANVTISNIVVRRAMWGIRIDDASVGIHIDAVTIDDIGQEAIRVAERSSYVTISNSTIKNTGRRPGTTDDGTPFSLFGEGIYLGTGKDNRDEVHHITIEGNTISRTTTEAIDIKQPVRDVVVANNTIRDIRTGTSGAIAIHIERDFAATNPNIRISGNTIANISTNSGSRDGVGIVVGSSVDIIGNTIRNTQHYGVRIDDNGSKGHLITANVRDNTISNAGIRAVHQSGDKATVNAANNRG